jgi:hypothetical protein
VRQAEIEQVDAVDRCRQHGEHAERDDDAEDRRHPARRIRIGDRLQRLHLVFFAAETGRQRVDDHHHQIGNTDRNGIGHDHLHDAGADAQTIAAADDRNGDADHRVVQECDDGRNCGQDQDVILEQPGDRVGFGRDDRPFGFRCQQDILDARVSLLKSTT